MIAIQVEALIANLEAMIHELSAEGSQQTEYLHSTRRHANRNDFRGERPAEYCDNRVPVLLDNVFKIIPLPSTVA